MSSSPSKTKNALWPLPYQAAVALGFDVDGPTGDAMLNDSLLHNVRYFTEGAYGPWRGVPRLLDLLDKHTLKATFFIPAWVVQHWPSQCKDIVQSGHEVAYHGYRHEGFYALTPEQQVQVMRRSRDIFQDVLGLSPCGFRTPSGDWSSETAEILAEFGVIYSSSMRGDDRPYFHQKIDGSNGLVEIPARWDVDDYTALAYFEDPDFPPGLDRIADYQSVAQNWIYEMQGFHTEGLCWSSIFHPKVCAKPGRLSILDQLFAAIVVEKNIWVATGNEIAHWWNEQYGKGGEGI